MPKFTSLDEPLRPGQIEELPPEFCRKWFGTTGRYVRFGVQGFGSCLYYSVCYILAVSNIMYKTEPEKRRIVEEFRCAFKKLWNKRDFRRLADATDSPKSFDEAADDFCDPRVWADELAIQFIKEQLGLNLIFLDAKKESAYCGVHGEDALRGAFSKSMQGGGVKRGAGAARSGAGSPKGSNSVNNKLQLTGMVLWTGSHRHFEPIGRIEEVDDDKGRVRLRTAFQPGCRRNDGTMVRHLMRSYAVTCDLVPAGAQVGSDDDDK